VAIVVPVSPSTTQRRSSMPVRSMIQSFDAADRARVV
jgi:hypothetical protein